MVVDVYLPAIDPRGDLIRDRRQWMQERLLIQVSVIAAPFTFLETLVVEAVELFCNGSFQILKAVKNLVPQPCDDRCCNLPHCAFHGSFLFGFTDACRHDGCLVVAAQGFIIRSQDNLPFSGMGYNARLQVIADKTRGNPAEEPIHVDVGADKAVHLHVPAWFHVGVLAVGQCSYKQVYGYDLPCGSVDIGHGRP